MTETQAWFIIKYLLFDLLGIAEKGDSIRKASRNELHPGHLSLPMAKLRRRSPSNVTPMNRTSRRSRSSASSRSSAEAKTPDDGTIWDLPSTAHVLEMETDDPHILGLAVSSRARLGDILEKGLRTTGYRLTECKAVAPLIRIASDLHMNVQAVVCDTIDGPAALNQLVKGLREKKVNVPILIKTASIDQVRCPISAASSSSTNAA